MNKLKKVLSILFALTLLAGIISACSSSTGTSSPGSSPSASADASASSSGTPAAASPSSAPEDDYVLRIGWGGSLCEAAIHIAAEKGFFDKEGLKYELVKLAPGTTFDAVTADQIDASFGLLASLIQPLSNGLPVKITTGLHTGCDKVLVKAGSGITTPKDFIGKTIGVTSYTASPYIFAKRVLADNGVDVTVKGNQVNFAIYSQADLPAALAKGAVDGIALNDPTATIAANQDNLNIIFDSAMQEPYKDQYCCSAYVRDNIITDHPTLAAKYTRAVQEAAAWAQDNKDEVAQLQVDKKYVAGDPAVNAEVLKTFNYMPSYQQAYDMFALLGTQMQSVGLLPDDLDVTALQKNSFFKPDGLLYN
ncbi:NitT/TauT family transport system substrate-binding protein [Sporobacter termitidis DSM 10068]|uniref:NitT/TauT family transport system substrate-binding protein n=1 Tax=Sporobacter termitidis DSM 10068 TaxID=1123282 RepID=A0A1M5TVF9_9FIRM|nr:ABC transporter substrate-binding protein [Sporobacter termitidis]SHH54576.1 NitT/TauT family transport system substrate-binding protein [Sporobacter termitidis DSM 10068]